MKDKLTTRGRTDPDAYMADEIAGMMAGGGKGDTGATCHGCVREGASATADEVCAACSRNPGKADRYERKATAK